MSALSQIKEKLDKEPDNLNMMELSGIHINQFTPEIKSYLQRFKKVKVLMLKDCNLDSLENLPTWKLLAIDISENNFDDNIVDRLLEITSLTQILLMDNQIDSLDNLKKLSALKHLTEVDFSGCPVADKPNYRPILFDCIKSLQTVDQRDLNGELVAEEEPDEEGSEYAEDEEFDSDEEQYEEQEEQDSSERPKKGKKK